MEVNGDTLWGLLVDSSRREFIGQFQGEMNLPLMLATGAMKMPESVKDLADAIGKSEKLTVDLMIAWSKDAGILQI
jgi:hypothetical protein